MQLAPKPLTTECMSRTINILSAKGKLISVKLQAHHISLRRACKVLGESVVAGLRGLLLLCISAVEEDLPGNEVPYHNDCRCRDLDNSVIDECDLGASPHDRVVNKQACD